jgi:hypothetical protein
LKSLDDRAALATAWPRCTKGSQHGIASLAEKLRRGAPLKTAARDLKPNADDDIGRQLHVLYGQSSLGDRLGKVCLEIFANPADCSRSFDASDCKPTP